MSPLSKRLWISMRPNVNDGIIHWVLQYHAGRVTSLGQKPRRLWPSHRHRSISPPTLFKSWLIAMVKEVQKASSWSIKWSSNSTIRRPQKLSSFRCRTKIRNQLNPINNRSKSMPTNKRVIWTITAFVPVDSALNDLLKRCIERGHHSAS